MWGQNPWMPSRGWTFFMFFFKLVPEEDFSKDCFMKQKPFNDNLVMASIESLYEQASHTVYSNTAGLRRHNPNNLPIIGSLPVQVGQHEGLSELDDIVLVGRLHAAFADDNQTKITAEIDPDKEQEGDPFLEIRQAVIAAGNNNQSLGRSESSAQEKSEPDTASENAPSSMLPIQPSEQSTEQTFAKHLAHLIDSEIEQRMAVLMQVTKNPSIKNKTAKQKNPKQRKTAKRTKKKKENAARKPTAKRPSVPKRVKPK